MKKYITSLTFIIIFFIFSAKASADNFQPYLDCPDGFVPYDDDSISYQVAHNDTEESVKGFFRDKSACLNPNKVGAVFEAFNILGKFTIFDPGMYYCPPGTVVGYDDSIPGYTDIGKGGVTFRFCCPPAYPYIRQGIAVTIGGALAAGNSACCDFKKTDTEYNSGLPISSDLPASCGKNKSGIEIGGKVPSFGSFNRVIFNDDTITTGNGSAFYCPTDSCFARLDSSGKYAYVRLSIAGGQTKKARAVTRKVDGQCETNLIDGYGVYCVEGGKVSGEVYSEFLRIGSAAKNACKDFVDTTEEENCLKCYDTCPDVGTCSYSSLGCIQTTTNGIIIRIFQIGLGVVGAFAIVRFIQAALLRQTADPSKIQESYDIITSIIIGLVVLLGSVVILKFIGVDVLQILPTDFLK